MLETIEKIRKDDISRNLLNSLADGWVPIKLLIPKLGVDRHTAYRRFKALLEHGLIEKSKRKHEASRYSISGFNLTKSGQTLGQTAGAIPSISLDHTMHAFEHNYRVDAELYIYPNSKASMLSSKGAKYHLMMGVSSMLLELMRDPNVDLGGCRLILDCRFEAIAELDVYEFFNDYLSPSLTSYIKNRTFWAEKGLSARIFRSPDYALNLIKLTRFTVMNYSAKIKRENLELIEAALDVATKEAQTKRSGWAYEVSPLIINAYLFMLAAIHHFEGELPEPERYFELWYTAIHDLQKLESLYSPLLEDLQRRLG